MSNTLGAENKPTYIRQRYLLAFLNQLNEPLQMTYIQKLVFLNEKACGKEYYDFVPYKYGPYSFQLAEDLDILTKRGFVSRNSGRFEPITGIDFDNIQFISKERGDELIRKAYREYPYYAINSEILEKLFTREEAASLKKSGTTSERTNPVLFTIGYEGRSIEEFINTLIFNNISALCDVRKNPLSRKFGFSNRNLAHILPQIGIKYYSITGLGIDSEKRNDLETKEDYICLFSDYAGTLNRRTVFLDEVYKLYKMHNRIALMCYEKDPQMCHRHVIRDYMVEKDDSIVSEDL